ncbi:MAG: NAD-dependent protein deacetylase [Candidatus Aminicenantes bacterium]|nr:NAD-dependent protein deacetylase [Candidatus Aminicenantes bacterium]MDH5385077.1 NAD-dependent protein deacetylase [Candidatus Aminicenantes bacterium]
MDILKSITSDIKNAKHIVAFTGAGISAESGIPTYRGEDGLWTKYDPNLYAHIGYFRQNPSYYWNFFKDVRYPMLKKVKPNKAHLALAEIESIGHLKTVITQNIDGLHQEAGSSSVIELHGTTRIIHCMECSKEYIMNDVFAKLEKQIPPLCSKCNGILRPAVVFFGEMLDPQTINQAYREAEKSDLILAVGSSLVVYPAADIPLRAKQTGAKLAIINRDSTPLDSMADYVINDAAGNVLPIVVENLKDV